MRTGLGPGRGVVEQAGLPADDRAGSPDPGALDGSIGNGIADSWENLHFGNTTTSHGHTDSDGDGFLDVVEWLNDTDPLAETPWDEEPDCPLLYAP